MKKLVLTLIAVMTMTASFAQMRSHRFESNAQNYELTFDMRRLASKLGLTADQMEAVQSINEIYNNEVADAATARGFERNARLHKAVSNDIRNMRRVLNDDQYNTYMMLLGTTLQNQNRR